MTRAADIGVVAILGDEDEYGDEAVEIVRARQNAHTRAIRQAHDLQREGVERILLDVGKEVHRADSSQAR